MVSVAEQNNYATKNVIVYNFFDFHNWARNLVKKSTLKYCLFDSTNIVKK